MISQTQFKNYQYQLSQTKIITKLDTALPGQSANADYIRDLRVGVIQDAAAIGISFCWIVDNPSYNGSDGTYKRDSQGVHNDQFTVIKGINTLIAGFLISPQPTIVNNAIMTGYNNTTKQGDIVRLANSGSFFAFAFNLNPSNIIYRSDKLYIGNDSGILYISSAVQSDTNFTLLDWYIYGFGDSIICNIINPVANPTMQNLQMINIKKGV
jgi:hypothetical protein